MVTDERIEKIKSWADKTEFPETLDGETKYYTDVNNTVEMSVLQLFSTDESTQMHAYSKLRQLARDLQVKENWNKPLATIEDLNRKL